MTYNSNGFTGGMGGALPGSYASRGKASHMKQLSVTPSAVEEAPRTSRSHLLAGLRTERRTDQTVPTTAPATQLQFRGGLNVNDTYVPQTATASSFGNVNRRGHQYTPSQVLAPPTIQLADENGENYMDPSLYEELVRTNQYLAEQQMRLRQQLISVTAAAQQYQNYNQHSGQMAMNPALGMYNQQMLNGFQPIVEAIPNQPGFYAVYNPMTGQSSYFFDQSSQQADYGVVQVGGNQELSHSPPPPTPTFRVSPTPESQTTKAQTSHNWRSDSPPKSTPTPPRDEATPLPPPSSNAFRPTHRKEQSFGGSALTSVLANANEASRPTGTRFSAVPQTPMSASFGPGHQREGEHPSRQPRGPPSMEELLSKPTAKHEGSKNFATRQRRRAVHNLVRAGLERRGASTRSDDSVGSLSPTSETEQSFSVSSTSDNDADSVESTGSSGKPRPIGSERKEMNERRNSGEQQVTLANIVGENAAPAVDGEKRKTTLLLLTNAGKRRSQLY